MTQAVNVVNQSISSDLTEKFEALFPVWSTVLATVIALLILLLVLTKLLYRPVKKMHDDRRDYIQNNIDSAELSNKEAVSDREKANDELITARLKAVEIIAHAKDRAEEVRKIKISKAGEEARHLIETTRKDMQSQQAKFEEESKEAIVEVALAAAAAVVEKEVDNSTNRKIINDFVKAKK
ncbi:MAG: F0F1 ATP synthase subunit B [Mycoplasmataceae bacterium]|nr:F0F1 ATP synthase subunit B [Mycoplasmataceae bacterium]